MRVTITPRSSAKKNKAKQWLLIECSTGMTVRRDDSGERIFTGYRDALTYAESRKWIVCTVSRSVCQKILDKVVT